VSTNGPPFRSGPPVLDPGHPRHDRAVVGTTSSFPTGMCLKFVRTCYNVPPQYATAAIAWSKTKYRHTSTPPKGVPVWWTGGSRVSVTSRSLPVADLYLHRQWRPRPRWPDVDIAHHQGMGTDVPGLDRGHQPGPRLPAKWGRPTGDEFGLRRVRRGRSVSPPTETRCGADDPGSLGRRDRAGLRQRPGSARPRTKAAYKKWQRKLGFRGADADGIPGYTSVRRLGDRHGSALFDELSRTPARADAVS
jgi:hypothetical protein